MHPKQRRSHQTRREFLGRAGAAALVLSGADMLTACHSSSSGQTRATKGPDTYPLARPDGPPVQLEYWQPPIRSGMKPERGGAFTFYNFAEYLDPAAMKEFGRKYGVPVALVTFDDTAQAIARLASGDVRPDVMVTTPGLLAPAVASRLLRPLNHDYIPNLKNVWPSLQSPFYDKGSRYTIPYTAYATGILWRNDHVTENIAAMEQPWDIFWHSQAYRGRVELLPDDRETIAMALLRRGIVDINTENRKLVLRAVEDLKQLHAICDVAVDNAEFETVPHGTSWLHQAWSGDMLAGLLFFLPNGTKPSVLSYWKPRHGYVPVQNDCWAICRTTTKPVLSHLWLNFILDNKVATDNFLNFNGYQPPISELDPDTLISNGTFPEFARPALLTTADFGPTSLQEMTLTPAGQKLWQNGYASFSASS
jgi:spermidine/putrescine transport system substrate-binding protein